MFFPSFLLKGQDQEIFDFRFFHQSTIPPYPCFTG
jgi:hypothetical protein